MSSTKFSIITATYNRGNLLLRLFESILMQDYLNIEWIIVDDGSNDNTKEVVNEFIKVSPFEIKTFNKENGGKHTALNIAFDNISIDSDLFLILDSDDMLNKDTLTYVNSKWRDLKLNKYYVGIIGLCRDLRSKSIIGNDFPYDGFNSTITKNLFMYNIKGDKCDFVRSSLIKGSNYPSYNGEKFVPESIITYEPDKHGQYYCVNNIFKLVEYQKEGITKNFKILTLKNPNGYFQRFNHLMQDDFLKQMNIINKYKVSILFFKFLLLSENDFFEVFSRVKVRKKYMIMLFLSFIISVFLYLKDMCFIHRSSYE